MIAHREKGGIHMDLSIKDVLKGVTTILLVAIMTSSMIIMFIAPASAATEDEIEGSILNGLAWLSSQQHEDGYWAYDPDWPAPNTDVATTGLVILKFVERAKELGLDPFDNDPDSPTYYEYADNVTAGYDYIFTHAFSDVNGVHFGLWSDTYTTGISMMAVAASNAPGRVITTGALSGWTYQAALQGMMDWMEYAQNDDDDVFPCDVGGWGYGANQDGWSDQSNTGYATLGLGFAAAPAPIGFGLTIPGDVLTKLSTYVDNVQDPMDGDSYDGGSWYEPCTPHLWVNILKTGNLLYEMALVGDDVTDARVQNAINYVEDHWTDTGQQPEFTATSLGWMDSYQAMFTMMKGFEAFGIDTISVGGFDIDWFDEVSTVIVTNQHADGYFEYLNTSITEGEQSVNLRTAWALLTLERVVPTVTIPVNVDVKPASWPNPFRLKSKGVLPVAVCGTEDFDVTTIDPATIQLTLEGVEEGVSPLRWSYEDVATPYMGEPCGGHALAGDGYLDLSLKFDRQELKEILGLDAFEGDTIPLILTGNLMEEFGGTPIQGQDCMWILE
ncbi:MAG: hypothetical protein JSV85_05030 [Candidatus Bathyarchaeota archaeon]|nr:MAG: hypothetical protein JSV85_05030 [Candidatus Bathyarchaeota archaeon]